MIELYPFQIAAKQEILAAWDAMYRKVLIVLPTGCGKTIVFSSVAETQVTKGHRVLILAHRGELLDQAAAKLKALTGLDCAFERADSMSLGSALPVTVGSVQSFAQEKRLALFPHDYFQDIIVDEAHHCLAATYKRILNHFSNANILGVTATPDRGDMKNLGMFFDKVAYEYSMVDAIRDGYLCPIKAQMIPLELDISNVRLSGGDFSAEDTARSIDPYLQQIACEMAAHCGDRKTVVFLPLIETSKKFCTMLNNVGFRAAEVNGTSANRSEVLADFEAGKYNVLCNSMLLTEGWDCPAVDCIVILRPTKIRSLYQQMVGRGTRLFPGKENLLLLDFLWMTERHSLCRPSTLVSADKRTAMEINALVKAYDRGIDLIKAHEIAGNSVLAAREAALARELEKQRGNTGNLVDPLQYAFSIAAEDLINYEPIFGWEMASPNEEQISFLERRGIFAGGVENAGLASRLIDSLQARQQMGLATPKQIRCLERYGFKQVGTWRFEDASSLISAISKNCWRVPTEITPELYMP